MEGTRSPNMLTLSIPSTANVTLQGKNLIQLTFFPLSLLTVDSTLARSDPRPAKPAPSQTRTRPDPRPARPAPGQTRARPDPRPARQPFSIQPITSEVRLNTHSRSLNQVKHLSSPRSSSQIVGYGCVSSNEFSLLIETELSVLYFDNVTGATLACYFAPRTLNDISMKSYNGKLLQSSVFKHDSYMQ